MDRLSGLSKIFCGKLPLQFIWNFRSGWWWYSWRWWCCCWWWWWWRRLLYLRPQTYKQAIRVLNKYRESTKLTKQSFSLIFLLQLLFLGGGLWKKTKQTLLSTAAQMDVSTDYKIQCLQVKKVFWWLTLYYFSFNFFFVLLSSITFTAIVC